MAPSSNATSCLKQVTGESLSQQRLRRLDAKGFESKSDARLPEARESQLHEGRYKACL